VRIRRRSRAGAAAASGRRASAHAVDNDRPTSSSSARTCPENCGLSQEQRFGGAGKLPSFSDLGEDFEAVKIHGTWVIGVGLLVTGAAAAATAAACRHGGRHETRAGLNATIESVRLTSPLSHAGQATAVRPSERSALSPCRRPRSGTGKSAPGLLAFPLHVALHDSSGVLFEDVNRSRRAAVYVFLIFLPFLGELRTTVSAFTALGGLLGRVSFFFCSAI